MPIGKRALRAGVASALALVAAMFGSAAPAHAYKNLPIVKYAIQNAYTCEITSRYGDFQSYDAGDACALSGEENSWDFEKDAGGRNMVAEIWYGNKIIGAYAFQAYDELVMIYDTSDDGDTFYVNLFDQGPGGRSLWGPYHDSASGIFSVFDLDLAEGDTLKVTVEDTATYGEDVFDTTWVIA